MFYHGTNVGGLKELRPKSSNQGKYVYFAKNRLSVFPYLANPCQVALDKKYGKGVKMVDYRIAQYRFTPEGKLVFFDVWKNYLEDTFKGQTGYIYYFEDIEGVTRLKSESEIYGLDRPIKVKDVEVIPDIYQELLRLSEEGQVELQFYKDLSDEYKEKHAKRFLETYKNTDNELIKEILYDKFELVRKYEKSLHENKNRE